MGASAVRLRTASSKKSIKKGPKIRSARGAATGDSGNGGVITVTVGIDGKPLPPDQGPITTTTGQHDPPEPGQPGYADPPEGVVGLLAQIAIGIGAIITWGRKKGYW
jgi:hypothetical protein